MIDDYLRSMTKCNNNDCNLKINCMRYNAVAKENLKKDNPCSLYFARIEQNENDAVNMLKNFFGFK